MIPSEHQPISPPLSLEQFLPENPQIINVCQYKEYQAIPPSLLGHPLELLSPPPPLITTLPSNPAIITPDHPPGYFLNPEEVLINLDTQTIKQVPKKIAATLLQQNYRPENTTFAYIAAGGQYIFDQVRSLLPSWLVTGQNTDIIDLNHTSGSHLAETVTISRPFNPQKIKGKRLVLFDGVADSNQTIKTAVEQANHAGARETVIIVAINKIGLIDKAFIPEIKMVGLGMPQLWMGGWGPDIRQGCGRTFPDQGLYFLAPASQLSQLDLI